MKRIFAILLVICVLFTLGVAVFATEGVEAPVETAPAPGTTENDVSDTSAAIEGIISSITNSTFWMTMGTVLTAVISCIAIFKKNFGNIAASVAKNADAKTINKALKDSANEITENFNATIDKIDQRIAEIENNAAANSQNEKNFITAFTLFVMNANMNQSAKNEILQFLTGIKDVDGKISDAVKVAADLIEAAKANEHIEPTPALDSIVAQSECEMTEMVLG